ncbi:hypothetical protein [Hazenella coriacea]|uniref:Uncharacterized protein n=1 Tax=Hazenella coriacea TaxID=1179467 RepID=A0A4R3L5R0_9BACL|nr:hypothetical protein [Hazenella coriacea]TCS93504.1 hypothetical protein EDD58_107152 [Hazenella coriacea]
MEYFMVPFLVLSSILAVMGTMYNKKSGNKPGFLLSVVFTVCLVGVTGLSLLDLFGVYPFNA